MSANTTAIRISELDFNEIKTNLKNYLRSQSEFQDFDFEGSGMSVLLDILAYNTHYMGYYLNMVANEMFLDTAQLRNSVLSHAKMINYIPSSRSGALALVNVRATPGDAEDNTTSTITLNKYTKFIASDIDGLNYQFVALNSNTALKVDGSFYFANVYIKQGEVVTLQYPVSTTNTKRRFKIPSANVDSSTIVVTVQESTTNTDIVSYSPISDITTLTPNTPAYFLEENSDREYVVYFGDNVLGKKPKDGSVVIITYLDTSGPIANNIIAFRQADKIGNKYRANVIITPVIGSFGGSERETIEQIRFRAPNHYVTQNRAVTKLDYETLILKDYPDIEAVSVWGGQDNDPPIYGKTFISLKPKDNYFLTLVEKEQIKNSLISERSILTAFPEIIDPDYVYLVIRGSVYYDATLTSLTDEDIKQNVRAAILDYRDKNLQNFNSVFRKTKLQSQVESSEKSITGSDIKLFLQKRITVDTTKTRDYKIDVNVEIKKGDYSQKITTFPKVKVFDSSNFLREVAFEETPSTASGIDSIQVVDAGINYSTAPTVTINGDGTGAEAVAKVSGGRLVAIEMINKGSNYSRATVTLSGEGFGAAAKPILEVKTGKLRTFYSLDSGEKIILNADAGNINYETGSITINRLTTTGTVANDLYDPNILTFELPIVKEVIYPMRNRIMDIDENDPSSILVSVVSE